MPNGSKGPGFTLVEMLAVVAIIALLAAFAFPALRRSMDARNEAGCVSNLRNLISAWSLYCADNAGYSVPIRANDSKRLYSSWVASLVPYLGEGNIDKMICCPAAHKASAPGPVCRPALLGGKWHDTEIAVLTWLLPMAVCVS